MNTMNMADAKAHFSEVLDRIENGESIAITRRGKVIAEINPAGQKPERLTFDELESFARTMPREGQLAGDFIRELRDGDRY